VGDSGRQKRRATDRVFAVTIERDERVAAGGCPLFSAWLGGSVRQVPGIGCAREGGGLDVDRHERVGVVGEQLAERGGVLE
jgi:hypothetical protein